MLAVARHLQKRFAESPFISGFFIPFGPRHAEAWPRSLRVHQVHVAGHFFTAVTSGLDFILALSKNPASMFREQSMCSVCLPALQWEQTLAPR